ncbi:MAG: UDP-N-acetylmuramoyl-tripeptide--D-alanyl-D-alanine ligase [Kiritimatiellaceae bacterium]|nr:UDP-N-acetylmuramoyl-tripeptide--D-alanyl-D-alanine ligase [Kiritimatiellaceae bacterium]
MQKYKYHGSECAAWLSSHWTYSSGDFPVHGINHDTRTLNPGDLYVAIRGTTHDGHTFVPQAVEKGASALLVERLFPEFKHIPQMVVPDAMVALWQLAAGVRKGWKGTVVGITGSVGKTTVKELIASVLAQQGKVCKTPGNWNNDIGLPLSMLGSDRDADFFVFELGMNHPGEIDRLAGLLRPNWAVITEIGKAHIEFFNSLEDIAKEKASILVHADGAILDETSEWFELFRSRCKGRIVTFGKEPFEFVVPLPGEHMIRNARHAAAIGHVLGLHPTAIQAGLSAFTSAPMRWESIHHKGINFINDAYNANPLSMRAALTTFSQLPCAGRRFAVLGGMRELGALTEAEHRDLGHFVNALNLDEVITIGEAGKQMGCKGILGVEKSTAAEILKEQLREGDLVLFKASRGEHLETILEEVIKNS